ncbi:MAG TPA: hypothetical protein VMN03_09135 [Burkholderiales bacterium]|nr:hypothetical protein [Burkholderiales bacterium]
MPRYLVVLLLFGCAHTPNEIRQMSERFDHTTALAPKDAAACIGRAIEGKNMQARWRDATGGSYEVIGSNAHGFMLVADIQPTSKGSSVAVYVQRDLMYIVRDPLISAARGC